MNKLIDRRNFVGLVGVSTISIAASPLLTSPVFAEETINPNSQDQENILTSMNDSAGEIENLDVDIAKESDSENNSSSKKEKPKKLDTKYYRFYTKQGGYLSIKNNSIKDGARVVLSKKSDSISQTWHAVVSVAGTMKLINGNSQKCIDIDVSNARNKDSAPLIQWEYYGGKNQRFSLYPTGDGWFILKSNLHTYITAASGKSGATLKVTKDKEKALKFKFKAVKYGTAVSLDASRMLFSEPGKTLKLKATIKPGNEVLGAASFSSSNDKIATVDNTGKVTARSFGECTVSVKVNGHIARCRVTVANKWAALTFDDGPAAHTARLLDDLKKRDVVATFFVVGGSAAGRKDLLRRMDKEGHEVANHTYSHNGSVGALINQMSRTDAVIRSAIGKESVVMRPPGGGINSTTYQCGKPIIMWTIDPRDWADRNASVVYSRVVNSIRSGAIILLHDLHASTVTAAPQIVDTLKSRGYAFVTASELLGDAKAGKVYYSGKSKPRTMKIP